MAPSDVSHSEIYRAVAKLGKRAGPIEVAAALEELDSGSEELPQAVRASAAARPAAT